MNEDKKLDNNKLDEVSGGVWGWKSSSINPTSKTRQRSDRALDITISPDTETLKKLREGGFIMVGTKPPDPQTHSAIIGGFSESLKKTKAVPSVPSYTVIKLDGKHATLGEIADCLGLPSGGCNLASD